MGWTGVFGRLAGSAGLALTPAAVLAFSFTSLADFEFGALDLDWDNKLAVGAQWRLSSRNENFIGKSNLDPSLCARDSCISMNRDNLEPHQRWMAARGSAWQIGDEGNLSHDRGDITSAVARWRSKFSLKGDGGRWGIDLEWQLFYDHLLDRVDVAQPNLIVEEGPAPGIATRFRPPPSARRENGRQFDLRTANVYFRIPSFGPNEIDVRIGRQHLNWGESLFAISGTLNFVTPVNFNNFFRPTMDLDEALDPVAMIHLQTPLTDMLTVEAFYQLEWRPYTLPSRGSLGSFIVDLGGEPENRGELTDDSFPLPFGKTPEDPLQLQRELTPVVGLISDSAASIPRLANREPRSGGQYGIKLSYFSDAILGGTEFSAYYANYHARLPAASFVAAQATCAAAEGSATGEDAQPGPFPIGLINFLRACGRDVSSPQDLIALLQDLQGEDARLVGEGFDALPISSARAFLDYPEDIQVFGVGFNTSALGLAWTGELAYRPRHPFQVDLEDVFFAALQPVFPRHELALFPSEASALNPVLSLLAPTFGLPLDEFAGATFTDRRNALPDYLTAFRGGTPGEVEPGSIVRGFEKFDFWQGGVGFTKLLGTETRLLGADQMAIIVELGATYAPDLPSLDVLQLDGLATTNTHFSPGIEETRDALKLNPFQANASGFPSTFAWGYKLAAIWSYDNPLLPGLRIRPQLILFHDVDGITPGLGGNFQQGRKIVLAGVNFNYRNQFSFAVDNFIFFGGGNGNRLRDRDFVNVSLAYQF